MPQSLATLRIHVIFSTKRRMNLIPPAVESERYAYMATVLKALDSPAIAIGGVSDHVHILVSLSKNQALSKVIEEVKTSSSKWIKRKPGMEQFYWQTGYAAFSIGRSNEPALIRYIHHQKQHHRKTDFKDELRAFLKKYEVSFREEYLWD
ncbi:MAG: IS200/IS605 family transposase [Planctomycetota bacterium]|nr:IS200/IS605 family transposase [Planctomycetota bacterium]